MEWHCPFTHMQAAQLLFGQSPYLISTSKESHGRTPQKNSQAAKNRTNDLNDLIGGRFLSGPDDPGRPAGRKSMACAKNSFRTQSFQRFQGVSSGMVVRVDSDHGDRVTVRRTLRLAPAGAAVTARPVIWNPDHMDKNMQIGI
jgi:hypothetical protein